MAALPSSPTLPGSLEAFVEDVSANPAAWFEYCSSAHVYIEQSHLRTQALDHQISHMKMEMNDLKTAKQNAHAAADAVREYQKEEIATLQRQLQEAIREKDKAIAMATPAVDTPRSTPIPSAPAEKLTAPAMGTPASTAPASSESSRVSERLPDPDKFEGDRKDLRRFSQQVYAKMTTNADRFPQPRDRLTYVAGRLRGRAYELILPKTRFGVPQFTDYPELLSYLESAFGDPDRVQNAQNELYRLKQRNLDFSVFLSEFQRLALEGEMPESSLTPLLFQNISRELQDMLLHNPAPSRQYLTYVRHLQELDNRFRQHQQQINRSRPAIAPSRTVLLKPTAASAAPPSPVPIDKPELDAMDLSRAPRSRSPYSGQPRSTRKDRGECYRCGSSEHLVRNCPLPDTRLPRMNQAPSTMNIIQYPSPAHSPKLHHPQPLPASRDFRSSSPTESTMSTKGVSLSKVTDRL
jgi:hypothetical protein